VATFIIGDGTLGAGFDFAMLLSSLWFFNFFAWSFFSLFTHNSSLLLLVLVWVLVLVSLPCFFSLN
jgi:hypothetical protein